MTTKPTESLRDQVANLVANYLNYEEKIEKFITLIESIAAERSRVDRLAMLEVLRHDTDAPNVYSDGATAVGFEVLRHTGIYWNQKLTTIRDQLEQEK